MDRVRRVQRIFNNSWFRSLKGKLTLSFLGISIIPLAAVGTLAFFQFQAALHTQTSNQLIVVRDLKIEQVDTYLGRIEQDINLVAELPNVKTALQQLEIGVRGQGLNQVREMGFLGRPDLYYLEAYSPYAVYHAKYHAFFRELVQTKGYADVWLVSPDGDILYTFAKRDDFATNLFQAPSVDLHPTQLIRNLLASSATDQVQMTDYMPYPPAGDVPVSFVGVPIRDAGKIIGGLIYQLSLDQNNDFMQIHTGFSKTGETYLVGADFLLRTKTRFGDKTLFFEQQVDTQAVRNGLSGESGVARIDNYQGVAVLSAYRALEVSNFKWVLLAEVEVSEAFGPSNRLRNLLVSIIIVTTLLVIGAGFYFGRGIAKPVVELAETSTQIAAGRLELRARSGGKDEIGHLGQAFNSMTGQLSKMIGSLEQQIEERKQAEKALHRLRNYLTNIIDSMPSALVGVDADGQVTQWNQTMADATGIRAQTARGKNLPEILPWMAAEMKNISESIRTRQVMHDRKKTESLDKTIRYEDVTIYPLTTNGVEGAVIRIDDVTDKVRMEEIMIQSEKMLSVGGLAAGMAHEINNPLAGMIQNADVMGNRLTHPDLPANRKAAADAGTTMAAIVAFMTARGIPRMLENIRYSGRRAADVVTNMLNFARKTRTTHTTHDLADLIDQTVELAGSDYDLKKKYDFRRIEIVRKYDAGVPPVPCEAPMIQQVLLNLLRNGAEAMQDKWLANQGEPTPEHPRFIIRLVHEPGGGMVRIEVEDNGPGMDAATCKRIFEPFFTTKPPDRGTGLGLSVSYFIVVENHGGELKVSSTQHKGTAFAIRLPTERKV